MGNISIASSIVSILKSLHTSADVRDEANTQEKRLDEYHLQLQASREIYQKLIGTKIDSNLSSDRLFLKDRIDRHFKRQGFDLPEEQFKELLEIRSSIASISSDFSKAVNDFKGEVFIRDNETDGLPESMLERLKSDELGGGYRVPFNYGNYTPIMTNSRVPHIRKDMYVCFTTLFTYPELNFRLGTFFIAQGVGQKILKDY
jgi:Zn-dependent oligopeptidase